MCRILHLHADYPDGVKGYPYTMAVQNLIKSSPDHEHVIVSINRTSNPFKVRYKKNGNIHSIVFWMVPYSLLYLVGLNLFYYVLKFVLRNEKFDVVHGHKITTEGYLAYKLALCYGSPLLLSLRGGTDIKNIKKYKYMKKSFSSVVSRASMIFLVSPWAKRIVEDELNVSLYKSINFPNPCNLFQGDLESNYKDKNEFKLYTVLSMHQYKRKGVIEVLFALSRLKLSGLKLSLDIYGTGKEKYLVLISSKIKELGLEKEVTLKGFIGNNDFQQLIGSYDCMVLPSQNETFGMAYVESLAAGVPIIYHKNTGIDGFIPSGFGAKISILSVDDVIHAIGDVIENHNVYKKEIHDAISNGFFESFTFDGVSKLYSSKVHEVLNA